ncbi:MAG: DUF1456 family protein [Fusobacteriota bacterium]
METENKNNKDNNEIIDEVMDYNDVLRRLRYALDLSDKKMLEIFKKGDHKIKLREVVNLLKKEDAPGYSECTSDILTAFLDGFIIEKRGRQKNKPKTKVKKEKLTNNMIMKKLRIALKLRSEDMLEVMELGGADLSSSELSAIFRRKGHRNYQNCGDRYVRSFLDGLAKYKGE